MRPEELQARQRQAQEMQAALQQQIKEKKRIKVGPPSRRDFPPYSAICTVPPCSCRSTTQVSQWGMVVQGLRKLPSLQCQTGLQLVEGGIRAEGGRVLRLA